MRHRTSLPHSLRCILDGFLRLFHGTHIQCLLGTGRGVHRAPDIADGVRDADRGRTVPILAPLQNAPVLLRVTMVGPPGRPDTGRPGCPAPDWSRRADTGRAGRDAAAPPGRKGACHRMAARRLRSRPQQDRPGQQLGGRRDRRALAVPDPPGGAARPGGAVHQARPQQTRHRPRTDRRTGTALPHQGIHVVADSAYGCGAFAAIGSTATMTTRARSDAVFYHLAPPRTGNAAGPEYAVSGPAPRPTTPPSAPGARPPSPATARHCAATSPRSPARGTSVAHRLRPGRPGRRHPPRQGQQRL
jgi:hypothetical protein